MSIIFCKKCVSIFTAFQKVPSAQSTANKFVKNYLHLSPSTAKKRQTSIEDIVFVLDGSWSIGYCEFEKAKAFLSNMMSSAKQSNPTTDTKYAAVTFAGSATVNFKFLRYVAAARNVRLIHYPGGMTNTQAGLSEALKLFRNTGSGTVSIRHVVAGNFPCSEFSLNVLFERT